MIRDICDIFPLRSVTSYMEEAAPLNEKSQVRSEHEARTNNKNMAGLPNSSMASNSTLPSEETISLVRSVYTAMTEEVAQEGRDNRRNSQSFEEELYRRFQLPRRGGSDRQSVVPTNSSAQRPEQFNPRVNYGSSGGKGKGRSRSCSWKGKSAIEKSTTKEITTR